MRTDVKLGLIASLVAVVVGGWYFFDSAGAQSELPILMGGDRVAASSTDKPGEVQAKVPDREKLPPTPIEREEAPPTTLAAADPPEEDSLFDDLFSVGDEVNDDEVDLDEPPDEVEEVVEAAAVPDDVQKSPQQTQPVASPPVVPSAEQALETHTVASGDTLASISRMYFGDERYQGLLLDANPNISNPDRLNVGLRIVIPDVAETAPTPEANVPRIDQNVPRDRGDAPKDTYTIQAGDTLYSVAKALLGSGSRWSEIYELNKTLIGTDPSAVKVGMILKLPKP
jgi:nucleoid-associated protein YgaU